jgi:hypothetical protein
LLEDPCGEVSCDCESEGVRENWEPEAVMKSYSEVDKLEPDFDFLENIPRRGIAECTGETRSCVY